MDQVTLQREKIRLQALIRELEQRIILSRQQLNEILVAERVFGRLSVPNENKNQPVESQPPGPGRSGPPTIKEIAIEALQSATPQGLSKGSILVYGRRKYGVDMNSGSLTVMLGRLRDHDRLIRNEGIVWYLTAKKAAS